MQGAHAFAAWLLASCAPFASMAPCHSLAAMLRASAPLRPPSRPIRTRRFSALLPKKFSSKGSAHRRMLH
jgi:hypothetical protein